jgi:hypothetical protein
MKPTNLKGCVNKSFGIGFGGAMIVGDCLEPVQEFGAWGGREVMARALHLGLRLVREERIDGALGPLASSRQQCLPAGSRGSEKRPIPTGVER